MKKLMLAIRKILLMFIISSVIAGIIISWLGSFLFELIKGLFI